MAPQRLSTRSCSALILVACITIVQSLGTSVSGTFSTVNGAAAAS